MDITFNPYVKTSRGEKIKRPGPSSASSMKEGFESSITKSNTAPIEEEASAVSEAALISNLLEVQELNFDAREKRQTKDHGSALLSALDNIRLSLLSGDVDTPSLFKLQHLLDQNLSKTILDPKLKEILEEIEVRAAVELAKRGYSF